MKKFFVCVGAVLAYLLLLFLGPALVMIFNNIGYYATGGGWGPGSLMYRVLQFFSQPISCLIAYAAIKAILKGEHKVLALTNCIIASCLCVLFVFTASSNAQMWAMIVSVGACIYTAVMASKDISEKNSEPQAS